VVSSREGVVAALNGCNVYLQSNSLRTVLPASLRSMQLFGCAAVKPDHLSAFCSGGGCLVRCALCALLQPGF
jgi:hypothetical protein